MLYKCLLLLFILTISLRSISCECNDVCSLPLIEPGRCRAKITRYGFDGTKCRKFTWGGCDDNGNNFDNIEQCRAACETPYNPDN